MEITSPSIPNLKYVVKLRSCSAREDSGEMIVEGCRECCGQHKHGNGCGCICGHHH